MRNTRLERLWKISLSLIFVLTAMPLPAREKNAIQYGMGLIVNVPFPESEVAQVVQDVAQNGIIRGTKEYNKDEYVDGAAAVASTRVFPEKAESGTRIFYKVRLKALDPRNFKDSGDVGTLAVRYILQPQGEKNTVLRIDARFVEDFRRTSHPSNGSVEGAEYKDIHDRLDQVESIRQATVEAQKEKQERAANDQLATPVTGGTNESSSSASAPDDMMTTNAPTMTQTLEQRVQNLRRKVERIVKSPGAPLKSAPFHTASNLQTLPTGTEVLVVVSTTYWLGVETHEGQHGWIMREQLDQVP